MNSIPQGARHGAFFHAGRSPDGLRPTLLQLFLPFWRRRENWTAYLKVALCIGITFGGTGLAIWTSKLAGQVIDAMVGRRWDDSIQLLATTVAVGLGNTALSISYAASSNLLVLQWRTWMSRQLMERWTAGNAFYDIERDGQLSNADQRIAEDVRSYTEQTVGLSMGFLSATVRSVGFGYVLWTAAGALVFEVAGQRVVIPGYMVWLAFLYMGIQIWLTHWVGKVLIGLNNHRQTVEADYRYASMKIRENAEQIAFYRGGGVELTRLILLFARIRQNRVDIVIRESKVMLMQEAVSDFMHPVPTLALLPRLFSGQLTLGGMTQLTTMFNGFSGALSVIKQSYIGITSWLAISNRLRDFEWNLNKIEARPRGVTVGASSTGAIEVPSLRLCTPHDKPLAVIGGQRFARGERWLVRGPSGAGKSTFLRAIAGLWPHGVGQVLVPPGASTMFLPQSSYIPDGTLKAALAYPAQAERFTDAECLAALQVVGLSERTTSLTETDQWQHKLSGGEQQRLAFARALLHQPEFLFMDEATSALDEASESALYRAVLQALPHSAIVSVAHRSTLIELHDRVLDLQHPVPT